MASAVHKRRTIHTCLSTCMQHPCNGNPHNFPCTWLSMRHHTCCTGMLLWGLLADAVGRKLGSRMVATIMLSGVILLTFTPFAPGPYAYFSYFLVAQTW
eukprot:364556-Chlamydomonas_euryale.AAC.15